MLDGYDAGRNILVLAGDEARTYGDAAARCLQDVLAYDPPNQRARTMLHELGYEVIDEAQEAAPPEYAPSDPEMVAAPLAPRGQGGYGEAPLPAYELEELVHELREARRLLRAQVLPLRFPFAPRALSEDTAH